MVMRTAGQGDFQIRRTQGGPSGAGGGWRNFVGATPGEPSPGHIPGKPGPGYKPPPSGPYTPPSAAQPALNQIGMEVSKLDPTQNQEQQSINLQTSQEGALAGMGTDLMNNYQQGKLPPGMQTYIENQQNQQISQVKQHFASLGLSGSTMEEQAINQVKDNTVGVIAQQMNQEYDNALNSFGLDQNIMNYFAELHVASMGVDAQRYGANIGLLGEVFSSLASAG